MPRSGYGLVSRQFCPQHALTVLRYVESWVNLNMHRLCVRDIIMFYQHCKRWAIRQNTDLGRREPAGQPRRRRHRRVVGSAEGRRRRRRHHAAADGGAIRRCGGGGGEEAVARRRRRVTLLSDPAAVKLLGDNSTLMYSMFKRLYFNLI